MKINQTKNFKMLYLRFLCGCVLLVSFIMLIMLYIRLYQSVPSNIKLKVGEKQTITWDLPLKGEIFACNTESSIETLGENIISSSNNSIFVDFTVPIHMKADYKRNYNMKLFLFGFIPFKNVRIQVIQDEYLIPMGTPIGIYVKTEGVLVVGVGEVTGKDGLKYSPMKYLLKPGDTVVKIDEEIIKTKKEFKEKISNCNGEKLIFTVLRKEDFIVFEVQPIQNQNGEYKIGVWIRDNAQGIGTLTYVDEDGNYGALGHGINDIDSKTLISLEDGTLYSTNIISIKKGMKGYPGEMTGVISYTDENVLGVVRKNTISGIYGTCNDKIMCHADPNQAMEIGLKQEVTKGPAQIYCAVEGKPLFYDIEIEEIYMESRNLNRGLLLRVTDEDLLTLTGGIVQGMSGSPIIQDGKIIGAVTHVLVNDPTRGYGIFIENMLEMKE